MNKYECCLFFTSTINSVIIKPIDKTHVYRHNHSTENLFPALTCNYMTFNILGIKHLYRHCWNERSL